MKSTRTAFERQILESVIILKERKHNYIMNAKAEYNRCALPRLTAKLGERDLEKWREEDKREMEKEATIEEKIRTRKKAKARERATATRRMEKGQPVKKKRRIEGGDQGQPQEGERETEDTMKKSIQSTTPKKRKVNKDELDKKKAKRVKRTDMRGYITCKRWRTDKDKEPLAEVIRGADDCIQDSDKPRQHEEAEVGTTVAEEPTPMNQGQATLMQYDVDDHHHQANKQGQAEQDEQADQGHPQGEEQDDHH